MFTVCVRLLSVFVGFFHCILAQTIQAITSFCEVMCFMWKMNWHIRQLTQTMHTQNNQNKFTKKNNTQNKRTKNGKKYITSNKN